MIRTFLAGLCASFALGAFATPHQHDGNDLWVTPNESGWGLNIFHQGGTLFASLFVYGPDGRAHWYTGSNLSGDDGGPLHDRHFTYNGPLYESTGPYFGAPFFNPTTVVRRQVGSMAVELATMSSGQNLAYIDYTVDGVHVTKTAVPFSFVRMGLTGSYMGYQAMPGVADDMSIEVTLNDSSFAMSTTGSMSGSCTYSGMQQVEGSLASIDGTYACNDGRSGSFVMRDIDVTRHGFTAKFSGNRVGGLDGVMVGARASRAIRGDGWHTDLWIARDEGGWGINIVEEGDVLFGTLFVYDSAGQAHWYSASDLVYSPSSSGTGRYSGTLYESTGPYFGAASFDPSTVTRRAVGTMTFEAFAYGNAFLDYTVDGVSVHKAVERFAFAYNTLAGSYAGHMTAVDGNSTRGVQVGSMAIDVSESGNFTMVMRGSAGTCTMRGYREQYGRQVLAIGTYDCGGAALGTLRLMDAYPTWSGFTASFSLDGNPIGRIEATRNTVH